MTRILKRGQKTYFKEDVVACLADETMQKIFTQSEYGNRTVWMEELQEEAKERFNMDFTDEDYKSFKTLIAKDDKYKYQILSTLQCDCQYFLGNGNCHEKHLWANNLDNHIQAMKMIYESFDEQDKPVWINNEMIDLYKDQMWTASLSKQANSLCDRLVECFEDMDTYEAMDCRNIDIDTQKHAVYEALVTGDTDDIITNLEDYKSACAGGDLEQYDKIQKLLDDVLQFEKNVNSNYVKRFDPHYAISISVVRDLLVKGTVIQCNHMRDPSHPVPDGTRGVVEQVDDAGLVHVKWENGSGLNLDPLVDDFEVIEDELDLGENQQEDEMEL